MKFSRKTLAVALIVAALVYYFALARTPAPTGPAWKVYGTMSCGWTRKQIEYMKRKGIAHVFVDCDSGACKGEDMDAFPVVESPDGARKVGYTEM